MPPVDIDKPSEEDLYERAHQLVTCARDRGVTVGTAESCTGGLVAAAVTEVPGSSEVLRGGVVSYAIAVKHEVLGVSQQILDDPALGAVSGECAAQMAQGARRVLACDYAVSITGIAGPGGEEPGKPVGTVWFGLSGATGSDGRPHVATKQYVFSGNRNAVRTKAVFVALGMLLDVIEADHLRN